MRKVGLLVAVSVALASAVWWLLQWSATPAVAPPVAANEAVGGLDTAAGDLAPVAVTDSASKEVVAPSATVADRSAVAGGLSVVRVFATWPGARPAAGVAVFCGPTGEGLYQPDLHLQVTDGNGVVTFVGLTPGKHQLRSDRDDRMTIDVVAGPQDVTFALAAGVRVVGSVRDANGQPVAGAGIWLQTARTSWAGGRQVASSDERGAFVVEHMPKQRSLGAFAKGHAPSKLVDLGECDTSTEPVQVELVLGPPGGELVGVVRDAQGNPVPGALVAVGKPPRFLDHRGGDPVEVWTPRCTSSDAQGLFAFDGLATGELPVAVRAPRFGIWRGSVSIAVGTVAQLEVVLAAAASVAGTVYGADGAPLAGADVSLYDKPPGTSFLSGGQIDYDEVFGHLQASTDGEGRYRIDGVAPGTIHAFAQFQERTGPRRRPREGVSVLYVREELQAAAAAEVVWNPTLSPGHCVAGVVLYADGQPLGDVFVTLKDERSGAESVMTNARDGTFLFQNLAASTFAVRVQYWDAPKGTPTLERGGIHPGQGRVELRAPFDKPVEAQPGTVLGRVDDAGARISRPGAVRVELHSDQRWLRTDGKLVDGAYRFANVDPCRFRIVLIEGETVLARSDWHELLPAATVDAGVLRTEPGGALRIVLQRGVGCAELEPTLYLSQGSAAGRATVELGRGSEALVTSLTPGDYEVTGYAKGMCRIEARAVVRAGETSEVTVVAQAGALRRFEVWLPKDGKATEGTYRIVDGEGRQFASRTVSFAGMPRLPYPAAVTVPVGQWRFVFATDTGERGEVAFAVASELAEETLRVDVR